MTRRFSLGTTADRKVVVLEVRGPTLAVVRIKPDGSIARQERSLPGADAALAAADEIARELAGRGYQEHGRSRSTQKAPTPAPALAHSAPKARGAGPARPPSSRDIDSPASDLFDDLESVEASSPPLARLAPLPAAPSDFTDGAPKAKKKGGKKKKKGSKDPDALDRRVLAVVAAVGIAFLGGVGYMMYDLFLKPPSIVGVWKGSMVEHEIGQSLTYTAYSLTLDGAKRATMAIDDATPLSGTYSVKGGKLLLKFRDEDGEELDREYRIKLERATLALMDADSGKLLVDLVRQFRQPDAVGEKKAKAAAAKGLADVGERKADPDADKALASVEFGAKDGAFKLRHPRGWTAQTGGRPDNTYSYISLEKGDYKIVVYADVTGSLISGSDSSNPSDFEEGSEFAPVQKAHEHFAKTGTEELGDYQEGKAEVFKDSALGEGRISVFTASAGMFGGKLKGYHVTTLTRDRRVSVLAYGPEEDFAKMRPTYLAVSRSLGQ